MNKWLHSIALTLTCMAFYQPCKTLIPSPIITPTDVDEELDACAASRSFVSEEDSCLICTHFYTAAENAHPSCLKNQLSLLSPKEKAAMLNAGHNGKLPILFTLILTKPENELHEQSICDCITMLVRAGAKPDASVGEDYETTPRYVACLPGKELYLKALNASSKKRPLSASYSSPGSASPHISRTSSPLVPSDKK